MTSDPPVDNHEPAPVGTRIIGPKKSCDGPHALVVAITDDGMGDLCINCGKVSLYISQSSGLLIDGQSVSKFDAQLIFSIGGPDSLHSITTIAIVDARTIHSYEAPEDQTCPSCHHQYNSTTGLGMTAADNPAGANLNG